MLVWKGGHADTFSLRIFQNENVLVQGMKIQNNPFFFFSTNFWTKSIHVIYPDVLVIMCDYDFLTLFWH